MQGYVTTSHGAGPTVEARARAVAEAIGLPMRRRRGAEDVPCLVIERLGVHLALQDHAVTSHPGMGLVRLRRLVRGEEHDPLLDLAQLRPGDTVLDATFGYGQDALVLAFGVGPAGRVVGLEASPLLAGLALAGLRYWPHPAAEIVKRIDVRLVDHRRFLAEAPERSYDVVFFDPMFRRPKSAAPDFAALRTLAETAPLTVAEVDKARRVARRRVIVKDAWPGMELKRLGIPVATARRSAEIVYGVIDVENAETR